MTRRLTAREVLCALDEATEPEGIDPICARLRHRGRKARVIEVQWFLEELIDLQLADFGPFTDPDFEQLVRKLEHLAATLGDDERESDLRFPTIRYVITTHGRALLRVDHDAQG